MQKIISALAVLLLVGCAGPTPEMQENYLLTPLLDAYIEEYYALNPLAATANGFHEYNDQLPNTIAPDYNKKLFELSSRYLDSAQTVPRDRLTPSDLLSLDIFSFQLSILQDRTANEYGLQRPVDQFVFSFPQNFATLGSGAGYIPFKSEQDYRNFMKRMEGFQVWVDQAIRNMQSGIELSNTVPRASMQKVPAQLLPLFEGNAKENIFYMPLAKLPADMDSISRVRLTQEYTQAIETIIQPTYQRLHDYIVTSYIPNTRESTGLLDNQNGAQEYAFWLKNYTTLDITADEIFDLGLREVARIRGEMDSVKTMVGFEGDLKEFFAYVKSDAKFFPFSNEEEVLDRYRSFEAVMEPQLQELFNLRPNAGFEVRATEKFREAGANAQYMRASRDGSRPGIFYETVRDPLKYNYIDMESLFIHEAIPGHHYQVAIQQEADIPEFRKSYWTSAFGEGWALYSESLGTALGMYNDPYQYLGRLNNEMERAVRLVVDAGMHHKGWTREEAIAYVLDNQPVTAFVAEQRIERYMVTPGQAVSYKVGEQKILELRARAQDALGDAFDIREFHDQVLASGSMPLMVLEAKIDTWIASKASGL